MMLGYENDPTRPKDAKPFLKHSCALILRFARDGVCREDQVHARFRQSDARPIREKKGNPFSEEARDGFVLNRRHSVEVVRVGGITGKRGTRRNVPTLICGTGI